MQRSKKHGAFIFAVCLVVLSFNLPCFWPGVAGAAETPLSWTQLSPPQSPSGRWNAAMAYDAAINKIVLFGGFDSTGYLRDTWTFDGTTWSRVSSAQNPPARYAATVAYDMATRQIVLFGGDGQSNNGAVLSDTWTFDGTNWKQQASSVSPPARYLGMMVYDAARKQVVLFGGADVLGASMQSELLSDTWTWDGQSWSQHSPVSSPAGRAAGAMSYSENDGTVTLFGGFNETPQSPLSDTWTWNGADWAQQSPAHSPPGRAYGSMSYDQAVRASVLFGGSDSNDTWTWDGRDWKQQSPSDSPSPRSSFAMAYDSHLHSIVLFGGNDAAQDLLSDTWRYGRV